MTKWTVYKCIAMAFFVTVYYLSAWTVGVDQLIDLQTNTCRYTGWHYVSLSGQAALLLVNLYLLVKLRRSKIGYGELQCMALLVVIELIMSSSYYLLR